MFVIEFVVKKFGDMLIFVVMCLDVVVKFLVKFEMKFEVKFEVKFEFVVIMFKFDIKL